MTNVLCLDIRLLSSAGRCNRFCGNQSPVFVNSVFNNTINKFSTRQFTEKQTQKKYNRRGSNEHDVCSYLRGTLLTSTKLRHRRLDIGRRHYSTVGWKRNLHAQVDDDKKWIPGTIPKL